MDQNSNNSENQEIDLSVLSSKLNQGYERFQSWIFGGFLFVKRNIIIIGILFILGVGMGVYLDKTSKTYDNKIIVMPNFNSTDYLYAKITLINSKIREKDTLFLKEIVGLKDPKKIKSIEIKPITDIYKFIQNKEENLQLIKLMAEDGEIQKVIEDNVTSKNYLYHLIKFTTTESINSKESVEPLMNYLNNSQYYKKIQEIVLNNVKTKIAQNDTILVQIDKFLNGIGSNVATSQKNDKLIYYNENTQLNDVIRTKEDLIVQQGNNHIDLENLNAIIKENSATLNVRNVEAVNGKLKLVLPVIFIFIFLLLGLIRSFYRKQMFKLRNKNS